MRRGGETDIDNEDDDGNDRDLGRANMIGLLRVAVGDSLFGRAGLF
jgi:hypothetical protein